MSRHGALLLLLACGCSHPVPQTYEIRTASQVLESLPPSHPQRATVTRLRELMERMTAVSGEEGMHGPHHKIDVKAEEEFWPLISGLVVFEGGDHLLAGALVQVYTRAEPNFYHGYIWHYPYLSTHKAAALAGKLLREYPRSALTERTLWLKAFALRVAPPERNSSYEESFPIYREQARHAPDLAAARTVYEELIRRFPSGRYGAAAAALCKGDVRALELPGELFKGDPREP